MSGPQTDTPARPLPAAGEFATTHWSVVNAAVQSSLPGAEAALERLCRTYWPPLYAFVRRQGHSPEEAQDLTQEFFARLLEKKYLGHAIPEAGRFRTFLLTSLKHFLVSEWRKSVRQKRGGGQATIRWDAESSELAYAAEAADDLTPERAFERLWVLTLMERVMGRLEAECASEDKQAQFATLRSFVWGEGSAETYADVASRLDLTEGAVKVKVHRLRQRCRDLLRAEIALTVSQPEDVDDELRNLLGIFSS